MFTTARTCLRLLGHMEACTYVVPCLALSAPAAGVVGIGLHPQQARPGPGNQGAGPHSGISGVEDGPRLSLVGSSLRGPTPIIDSGVRCLGWGAHLGGLSTQGYWSGGPTVQSTNVRDLSAVCQAFRSQLQGKVVQVLTDISTMFYINKQGRARSSALCQEALQL